MHDSNVNFLAKKTNLRRYVLYVAIALLAFATGLFFVHLFFLQEMKKSELKVESVEEIEFTTVQNKPPLHQETGVESLTSDKQKALLLFEPTLKRWLRNERIADAIEPSPEIIERIAETRLHRYEAPYLSDRAQRNYMPSLIDLNGDGRAELAIIINHNETDSGDLWILQGVDGDFDVILHSREKLEKFEIKKTKSNGFSDIQTSYYPNEPEIETFNSMTDYKFNGKQYTLRGCSEYVDRYRDKNGELRYLKKPIWYHLDDCC